MGTYIRRFEDRFDEIIGEAEIEKQIVLDHTAQSIVDTAAENSRVDTGAMRDGWTWEEEDEDSRVIYNDVPYTIFHEYGTVYMAAQPMLAPAIEEHGGYLIGELSAIYH